MTANTGKRSDASCPTTSADVRICYGAVQPSHGNGEGGYMYESAMRREQFFEWPNSS